jgi:hypothetical protein
LLSLLKAKAEGLLEEKDNDYRAALELFNPSYLKIKIAGLRLRKV